MDNECAVKIEELARKRAFMRFQEEILFSLLIYTIDKNIQVID